MVDASGNTLFLDQNAIVSNGFIYVPNANSLIKDGKVFVPQPNAVKDEATGNYFVPNAADTANPTMISEVVVDSTLTIFAQDVNSIVQTSTVDNITLIPYTKNPTAQ